MVSLQTLVGPTTDSERTRLKARLRFTRTINLRNSRPIETAVFNSLATSGLYACITPHLHAVYGNCGWYNLHEALIMLSGSFLRDLVLDLKQLRDLLGRRTPHALTRLCAAAPNIERLVIRGHSVELARACIGAIAGLKQLRTLDLSTFAGSILDYMDLLRGLACLDHFVELSIPDTMDTTTRPYDKDMQLAPVRGFRSLKKLAIAGGLWTAPLLFAALPDVRLAELRLVGLKHACLPPMDELVLSFSAVLRQSLEVLHVGYVLRFKPRVGAVGPPPAPPDIVDAVSPLFALPNIRVFSLATEGDCNIQDDNLLDIGEAWGGLVSLCIQHTSPASTEVSIAPSVHGVIALIDICPNLRRLVIPYVIPLHAGCSVKPAYMFTGNRYDPHPASLPRSNDKLDEVDTGRLVDIMWPLFGVADTWMMLNAHLFLDYWGRVLCGIAHEQNIWEGAAV